jgi:hypothetical protein
MVTEADKTIWFDFENAPQVLVLQPVIERFREAGYETIQTARRFSMTVELCKKRGLAVHVLGSGSKGHSRIAKIARVMQRAFLLWRLKPLRQRFPLLGISHASRSQLIAGRLLGIPVVILDDYEHSDQTLSRLARSIMVPSAIPAESFGRSAGSVVHYPGLKEDLYLTGFSPSGTLPDRLTAENSRVIVVLRPEGRTAHYRSEESARLQKEIIRRLAAHDDLLVVTFPRDAVQESEIRSMFQDGKADVWFPGVLDGPELITCSDLVIGGGGTMTREASALGIPSYSFFSGEWGAVDEQLEADNKLFRIRTTDDINEIRLEKKTSDYVTPDSAALDFVTRHLIDLADSLGGKW